MSLPINPNKFCFYDPTFNPRFSESGDRYADQTTREKIKTYLFGWLTTIKIQFNIWFCSDEKEKILRKHLWSCVRTEECLDKYERSYAVKGYNSSDVRDLNHAFETEHVLFEQTNQLMSDFNPNAPLRMFPSELLRVIHCLTYNQNLTDARVEAKRRSDNWFHVDLGGLSNIGLTRLAKGGKLKHKNFVQAIDLPAKALTGRIRHWRAFLNQKVKTALASRELLHLDQLKNELSALSDIWKAYVNSHEALGQIQKLHETKDYFKTHVYELRDEHHEELALDLVKLYPETFSLSKFGFAEVK